MIYFEAPDTLGVRTDLPSVFLAGGITGCPPWQNTMVELLRDREADRGELVVINPRRSTEFTEDMADAQIKWEWFHLRMAERLLFWFPSATLCPITLYELGAWSMTDRPMVVGCEPGYARTLDVVTQTGLVRPDVTVVDTLEDLADEVYLLGKVTSGG
jgi:hypothetical protein